MSLADIQRNRSESRAGAGFSLIEILVVVTLLVVIIFGLLVMFNQTQRAFQTGMTQVDILEGGRAATDMIGRELQEMTPSYQTNCVNFYSSVIKGSDQTLPGVANVRRRINSTGDLFFLTKVNQYWTGIGYHLKDEGGAATLYRFEEPVHVSGNPARLFSDFLSSTNQNSPFPLSRVLEGIVDFKVRVYSTNGVRITGNLLPTAANRFNSNVQPSVFVPGEYWYTFGNDAVPAFVEFELAILEQRAFERLKSIPNRDIRRDFLETNQVGSVHVFRLRVPVRNVDTSAYR